jgi:hypothetical protein
VISLKMKAVVSAGALLVATVATGGTSTAQNVEPLRKDAVSRHSFSAQVAASKVENLWASKASWARDLADEIVYIHPGDGKLVVLVKDDVTEIHDRVPADLKPFVTVARGGIADAAGSPVSDRGGWTGGNHISSENAVGDPAYCTEGFAWKSWATGAVLGSTARHCYTDEGGSNPFIEWYHDGRHLGTRTQAGTGTNDVLLLRPAPDTSFNASIWVWLTGGGVAERTVAGAAANKVGDTVAFYGRTSGGGIGTVTAINNNGNAGTVFVNATQVRPGDSGGPVYRTYGNGTVEARGTVSAMVYYDGNSNGRYDEGEEVTGMIYIDATYTSANLGASIYTA